MKVITQLILHFWQRGALTSQEIEYLLLHDFVQPDELPGYESGVESRLEGSEESDGSRLEFLDTLEQVEEELVRRHSSHARGKSEVRADELRVADIRERLQNEFERRNADLASVLALGQRIESVDHWHEAASELRSITKERFYEELCAELRQGDVRLGDIWQASDPEPFHQLIADSEARGRAARSFLALLIADGPEELGKYSWILKYDEMQSVINLRVLHYRLLKCLRKIYQRDRLLLTHALAKNSDPVQVWALVILYNAYRNPRPLPGEPPQYGKEYGPVFMPDLQIRKHAWTSALRMDRTKVTELMLACCQQEADNVSGSDVDIDASDFSLVPLMCPVGWHLP